MAAMSPSPAVGCLILPTTGRCARAIEDRRENRPDPRDMTRKHLLVGAGLCLAALLGAGGARADELPTRKPGLWEMKITKVGSSLPQMTMEHCTDASTDKDMANTVSPMAKQICTKQDVEKTSTGYVTDSVCSMAGMSMTSHSDITGDFNSAYLVTTVAHIDKGPSFLR